MADAAKKTPEPVVPAAAPQEPAPKKPKDLLSLLTLGLVGINLCVLVGLGLFVKQMWGRIADLQIQVNREPEPEPVATEGEGHDEHGSVGVGKEYSPAVQGTLYPLESFLVNISSDQGPKFLQTQMELELADPALEDEITRKKAAIRDAIIVLLSSRTYKQLREPSGMKVLRSDILKAINNLLTTGKIRQAYFTQFHFN